MLLTDVLKAAEKASGLQPCCVCVSVFYIWRRHWVTITHGNLKIWMWAVRKVFCFIEITFTIPMTLKDYSEVMLHVYGGAGMSYIWKCDWNALRVYFQVYEMTFFSIFFFKDDKHSQLLWRENAWLRWFYRHWLYSFLSPGLSESVRNGRQIWASVKHTHHLQSKFNLRSGFPGTVTADLNLIFQLCKSVFLPSELHVSLLPTNLT